MLWCSAAWATRHCFYSADFCYQLGKPLMLTLPTLYIYGKLVSAHKRSCGKPDNVFTGVCLSFCWEGEVPMWPLPMLHWDIGIPRYPGHGTYPLLPATDIWCLSLETYSNLFTWGPAPLVLTSSNGFWNTYGWQAAARILLECCLVLYVPVTLWSHRCWDGAACTIWITIIPRHSTTKLSHQCLLKIFIIYQINKWINCTV